jgi:hypothetical protein
MRVFARLALLLAVAIPFGAPAANAAPKPIPFCMPDLDGHCRYCEIRFAPVGIVCTTH